MSQIIEVIEHITVDGDRWDNLAWQYYGDANAYEQIIAANPEVMIIPILPGGIKLLIPVIEEDETESTTELPPWKQ
ncbi:MAG: tail protein X [Trichlorobacter sp.]|uniref:tail protein X n=1 Tax=Trichlorobacter sp. TaxID=2911007 RepID=UPI002565F0F5|nr:tail protein X [Trichlorobacter sp.]